MEIAGTVHRCGLAEGEIAQALGKIRWRRYAAPSISTGITGIFLASAASISMRTQSVSSVNLSLPLSSGVAQRGPTMATRISQRSRILNVLAEIESEGNRVDVHEDIVFAEMTLQPIMDAPGDPRGILSAVGKDDGRHGSILSPYAGHSI